MTTLLLAVQFACKHPTPAPKNPEKPVGSPSECAFDSARETPPVEEGDVFGMLLGMGAGREIRDCPPSSLPPEFWEHITAERLSHKSVGSIDSREAWIRYDGVTAVDLEALAKGPPDWGHVSSSVGALPNYWPIKPSSSEEHLGRAPDWFPSLDTFDPALPAVWSQWPAVVDDCQYARGMGVFAVRDGAHVYVYEWNFQHFYPTGGCGA